MLLTRIHLNASIHLDKHNCRDIYDIGLQFFVQELEFR